MNLKLNDKLKFKLIQLDYCIKYLILNYKLLVK